MSISEKEITDIGGRINLAYKYRGEKPIVLGGFGKKSTSLFPKGYDITGIPTEELIANTYGGGAVKVYSKINEETIFPARMNKELLGFKGKVSSFGVIKHPKGELPPIDMFGSGSGIKDITIFKGGRTKTPFSSSLGNGQLLSQEQAPILKGFNSKGYASIPSFTRAVTGKSDRAVGVILSPQSNTYSNILLGAGVLGTWKQNPSMFAGTGQYERGNGLTKLFGLQNQKQSNNLGYNNQLLTMPSTKDRFNQLPALNQRLDINTRGPQRVFNPSFESTINIQQPNQQSNLGLGSIQASRLNSGLQQKQMNPSFNVPFKNDFNFGFDNSFRFGGFPLLPPFGLDEGRKGRGRIGKRKYKRLPSLLAADLGITAPRMSRNETTGLVLRPLISTPRRRKR
jgi:hypothetical protein